MYSDHHFEDDAFGIGASGGSRTAGSAGDGDLTFGLNNELLSDPIFPIDPILQTIGRSSSLHHQNHGQQSHLHHYHHQHDGHQLGSAPSPIPQYLASADGRSQMSMHYGQLAGSGSDDERLLVGNELLGSPQPTTVKKLRSHLSGVGVMGGYLTSPMGTTTYATAHGGNAPRPPPMNLTDHLYLNVGGSSPAPPMMAPMTAPIPYSVPSPSSTPHLAPASHMLRMHSAPAPFIQRPASAGPSAPTASSSSSSSNPRQTRASSAQPGRGGGSGGPNAVGLGIPGAGFNELDYGNMRIYGRPIDAPPSRSGGDNAPAASSYLPYPEHMPTTTLGRGAKNTRDIASPTQHASFPVMKQESLTQQQQQQQQQQQHQTSSSTTSIMLQPNIDKPFIQYVPPNSPAAKSARNRKQLSVKTGPDGKPSQKLVPIKMSSPRPQIPLSPPQPQHPISRSASPSHQPQDQQQHQHSPAKPAFGFDPTQQYLNINMPSFAFSLQQFGDHALQPRNDNQIDLQAVLGLNTPGLDSCSSDASSCGMLSPPLHSAASTSSSFSINPPQMFGMSPNHFTENSSIDQALASLLDGHQLSQTYSPDPASAMMSQQSSQQSYGISSDGLSPPALQQWPQYSHQGPSSYFQPQMLQNDLLSPQHPHLYGNAPPPNAATTSPRRLRAMQSAPDLNQMNQVAQNGTFQALSPRRVSLKRHHSYCESPENSNSDESRGILDDSYSDGLEDEYVYGDENHPPSSKRRASSAGGSGNQPYLLKPNPSRLRPGPKPKISCPNLQAAHQSVFVVEAAAPPMPAFPSNFNIACLSPNLQGAHSPLLSPDPAADDLLAQSSVSKDMLANFYSVGTGSRQTKKGKPQRMYLCAIPGCGKEFPRKSAVESHIQTHLEDKPFACPYDDWYIAKNYHRRVLHAAYVHSSV